MPITKLNHKKNDTIEVQAFEDEAASYDENDGLSFADKQMIETEELLRNSDLPKAL